MALAVSFFAAANLMMLAWAVWAGHFATMGQATRDFFHWIAALIAVPSVYYAGLPFYRSAIAALRKGRSNMDVPISVGVTLTTAMSMYETWTGGPHVYFDGALMLLFILLVGRYLDHKVRGTARSAVHDLAMLAGQPVQKLLPDGTLQAVASDSWQVVIESKWPPANASAWTASCAKAARPSTRRSLMAKPRRKMSLSAPMCWPAP